MNGNDLNDMDLHGVLGLNDIRTDKQILSEIKFDVTPQDVMEPRFHSRKDDLNRLREIAGYMFYVESQTEPPGLMLLKTGRTDVTSTVGRIDEAPLEMLRRAIEQPASPPSHGMYAITDELRDWLKKELGL